VKELRKKRKRHRSFDSGKEAENRKRWQRRGCSDISPAFWEGREEIPGYTCGFGKWGDAMLDIRMNKLGNKCYHGYES
jgi:hypothetical protein